MKKKAERINIDTRARACPLIRIECRQIGKLFWTKLKIKTRRRASVSRAADENRWRRGKGGTATVKVRGRDKAKKLKAKFSSSKKGKKSTGWIIKTKISI